MKKRVTYKKGPLGYAVLLDGKAVGSIKDRRNFGGWQINVPGLNAALAVAFTGPFRGQTVHTKLVDAKAVVETHLTGEGKA